MDGTLGGRLTAASQPPAIAKNPQALVAQVDPEPSVLHLHVEDIQAISLFRPSKEIMVQTNVLLAVAGSNNETVTFKIRKAPALGLVMDGKGAVLDKDTPLTAPKGASSAYAIYVPNPGPFS